jgi:hypothetical protein
VLPLSVPPALRPAEERTALLGESYPNPFALTATIPFTIAHPVAVSIEILDAIGRRVRLIHRASMGAGSHAETLDAGGLAPGVYCAVLRAGAASAMRTIILTR